MKSYTVSAFLWSAIPFSDAVELTGVLFWDRRRPRLLTYTKVFRVATVAGEDACGPRRARPLVQQRH